MSRVSFRLIVVVWVCSAFGCNAGLPDATAVQVAPKLRTAHAMVVSVSPLASRRGAEVMAAGGNAVDASVATAMTLAVTWPEAGNIGGGGFMLVARPAQAKDRGTSGGSPESFFVDYRETAPAAVVADSFANHPSEHHLAGTPGTVAGLYLAFTQLGSGRLTWRELVQPAADLARRGFAIDAALADSLNAGLRGSQDVPEQAEFRRVYGKPDGSPWKAGDRLVQPDLADTLARMARLGPQDFYKGLTAERLAAEMRAGGGLMTADDLASYEAKIRKPLEGTFGEFTILASPPPSSGGVALLQVLNMLEPTFVHVAGDHAGSGSIPNLERWSASTVHRIVEAMRRAYADRARYLGDPDFVSMPIERLIDKAYARQMWQDWNPDHASKSVALEPRVPLNDSDPNTTHFSVVDSDGMAVSNTYTLEAQFGGKIVVRGAGFLLNNELGDFNPRPGKTTTGGQIGTPPNTAIARKRPLSSMSPTIVCRGGRVFLVTGSPGGRTIINTVVQVVLNRLAFDMSLEDAVAAARLHHQWLPDQIRFEERFVRQHPSLPEALKAMGHHLDPTVVPRQGDAHSIEIDARTGERLGVADDRVDGAAAGF